MSDRIEQLKEEVSSIIEQYKAEVSGRRKPWPLALKKRVLELTELGVPQIQLIHLTGISYVTILEWRKAAGMKVGKKVRKSKFHPLTVKPTAMAVVDEPKAVLPKTVLGKIQPQTVVGKTARGCTPMLSEPVVIVTPEGLRK